MNETRNPDTLIGIVKWWNEKCGYGYITVATENGFRDYFAHWKNILSDHRFKKLKQDWICSFVPNTCEKGNYGTDIRVLAKNRDDYGDDPKIASITEYLANLDD